MLPNKILAQEVVVITAVLIIDLMLVQINIGLVIMLLRNQ